MNELESVLNSDNAILIAQAFSKIAQQIESHEKNPEINESDKDCPEVSFLKEKCLSFDRKISIEASNTLLYLVKMKQLNYKPILSDILTTITTTKFPPHVAYFINHLLLIEIELADKTDEATENVKCPYNLRLPQHPFLIMLNENENCFSEISKLILYNFEYVYSHNYQHTHLFELHKAVFLSIVCNPSHKPNRSQFKEEFWGLLASRNCLLLTLPWINLENRDTLEENTHLLCHKKLDLSPSNEIIVLLKAATLYYLVSNNFDPYLIIKKLFNEINTEKFGTMLILIIAKSIYVCPSVYFNDLLEIVRNLLPGLEKNYIETQVLKASLLQWIANPSILAAESVKKCKRLLETIEKQPKKSLHTQTALRYYENSSVYVNAHPEVYFGVQLAILTESWRSENDVKEWLDRLAHAPDFFIEKITHFLYGVFLADYENVEITRIVLRILLENCNIYKNNSFHVLTLVLYKLSTTIDSLLHLDLLRALPRLGVLKINQFKVMNTIKALHQGTNTLKTLSLTLMFELWQLENKCYSHLEKLLIDPIEFQVEIEAFYVTRAHVLKELCALKPELYGKDMVAHLSRLLNDCNHPSGALASSLALDGISLLCKSEIIDALTTWTTLAPMFATENRTVVIESICRFIAEIPHLSYIETQPDLMNAVVAKLWHYVELNDSCVAPALDALTNFPLDQITALMPAQFIGDDELLKLKETGTVLPGKVWPVFLRGFPKAALPIAGDFLVKLARLEVAAYLKFVYQAKGAREPLDYGMLAANSVVRGLVAFVKARLLKWRGGLDEEVYLECLRVLSREYSRPLPPLDWCFLQELAAEEPAKRFCIDLACHQVMLSGTARRFIVNYIEAIAQTPEKMDEILVIYENLRFIANSVQPITLKPFIDATIKHSIAMYTDENDINNLNLILEHIKIALRDENVQEANKDVIYDVVKSVTSELGLESPLFGAFLDCFVCFSPKQIDEMTVAKSGTISNEWLRKATKIRCLLALNSTKMPLNHLNCIIRAGNHHLELSGFIFAQFISVFNAHKANSESVFWLHEFLGEIQAAIIERIDVRRIQFYCDVLIVATIVFSGHLVFIRNMDDMAELKRLFPRAIACLLDVNHWSICTIQALEWFHYMITNRILSQEYSQVFIECLQCLKNEQEFRKNMKWVKYMNVAF